jgi:hypothetical protein
METPEQQPDPGGETPTQASLPSDSESEGDARQGDDEHQDEVETDEESAEG